MILKNWQERALKTFVQAFLGVLIPETVYLLNNAGQTDFGGLRGIAVMAPPALCSALAAGLSAVWNLLAEYFASKEEKETVHDAAFSGKGENDGTDA